MLKKERRSELGSVRKKGLFFSVLLYLLGLLLIELVGSGDNLMSHLFSVLSSLFFLIGIFSIIYFLIK